VKRGVCNNRSCNFAHEGEDFRNALNKLLTEIGSSARKHNLSAQDGCNSFRNGHNGSGQDSRNNNGPRKVGFESANDIPKGAGAGPGPHN